MNGPTIAVLGATGNVGEALLTRLAASTLAGADVSAYASRATRRESVSFGTRTLPVRTLAEAADAGASLVFCALPPALAQRTVPSFTARGALVVDVGNSCTGLFAGPLCLPELRAIDEAAVARAGGVRTPGAVGWMLATMLAPLLPLGAWGVNGLVNLPVTTYGRLATEEFTEQVVAAFNSKDPPRRRFPDGLAFDTLPEDVDAGEWSDRERLAAAEVSELLGVNPARIGVQLCTQPVFNGITAALHIRGVDNAEAAETALREAPGLATAARMTTLRPRRVHERAPVYFGGVRADPAGDGIHLWLVADNLAGAGAAVPVAVAERLLASGVSSGIEA